MLSLALETLDRLRYKIPSKPRQVQIEITNRCNMDCPMCPREVLEIELEHMDWDKFVAVVDQLNDREEITLTGWGEPFLHPQIFEMISYCKERGHKVMITSNGLFPKPFIVEKILQSGLDVLTFSIDSLDAELEDGHNNNKVYENIETVARIRKNGTPSLRLQATLHAGRENDLYDVIRYGARIGCEIVNVGRLDRTYAPELKRPDQKEEERIFWEADRIAQSCGIQLDWLQYSVSRGLTRFFYRLLRKKLHRSGQYCLKTFNYAYVSREGNVTPCCLLPSEKMGNALESNLQDIWNNESFNHFRENYRNTCGSCDLWTISQVADNG
ncbi:MAG: radical SAM protein [Nitrospinota bacterium]|nr:radical SAM protein [Nitrospinota bacterium]